MIRLRKALPDDIPILKYWDTKQHVIDCDPDEEWNWEKELQEDKAWREQWMAIIGDEPIGFIQIIDPYLEETHYWEDAVEHTRAIDIWIGEESNLGKGYGTQMMKLALARCFADPKVHEVLIDPLATNTKAHRFYEKLGFRFVEERTFGDSECCVFKLERRDYRAF